MHYVCWEGWNSYTVVQHWSHRELNLHLYHLINQEGTYRCQPIDGRHEDRRDFALSGTFPLMELHMEPGGGKDHIWYHCILWDSQRKKAKHIVIFESHWSYTCYHSKQHYLVAVPSYRGIYLAMMPGGNTRNFSKQTGNKCTPLSTAVILTQSRRHLWSQGQKMCGLNFYKNLKGVASICVHWVNTLQNHF